MFFDANLVLPTRELNTAQVIGLFVQALQQQATRHATTATTTTDQQPASNQLDQSQVHSLTNKSVGLKCAPKSNSRATSCELRQAAPVCKPLDLTVSQSSAKPQTNGTSPRQHQHQHHQHHQHLHPHAHEQQVTVRADDEQLQVNIRLSSGSSAAAPAHCTTKLARLGGNCKVRIGSQDDDDAGECLAELSHSTPTSTTAPRKSRPKSRSKPASSRPKAKGAGKRSKLHKCADCGRVFARSDMLSRHSRLHSGLKPYQCARCCQVFSRSDHLATHERTHTGEKPYQCHLCSYSACRRDMITRHMRTHGRRAADESKRPL